MFTPRTLLVILLSFSSMAGSPAEEQNSSEIKRRVMTWVAPYAIGECHNMLATSFDGKGPKDGLTHLGLQFWGVSDKGNLEIVTKFKPINDVTIRSFRQWGTANDVKVMLCVYNGTSGWDWNVARLAFDDNREAFIDALVKETVRLGLDGIDIDFEAKGQQKDSKQAYVTFIKELAVRLRAEGKELAADTFAYKWNAPNQSWWPDLLPHLDALHVMGYSETGSRAEGWRSYEAMKKAGGQYAHKLVLGVPSHSDKWQGVGLQENLQWLVDDGEVSIAIWDAQLKSPAWRTQQTWLQLSQIKTPLRASPDKDGSR